MTDSNSEQAKPESQDVSDPESSADESQSDVREAPTTIGGILKQLGPGLIVAGSIVGSGELIATTVTGAKAGFWLLWLIIIGCVIKVFVQVEMGRYSVVTGKTAMDGFDDVPGPRIRNHGNWLIWYWFVMFVASIGQLGGIVGGVGQALSISYPITQYGKDFNAVAESRTSLIVARKRIEQLQESGAPAALDAAIRDFSQQELVGYIEKMAKFQDVSADNAGSGLKQFFRNKRLENLKRLFDERPEVALSMYDGMLLQEQILNIEKRLKNPQTAKKEKADAKSLEELKFKLNIKPESKGLSDLVVSLGDPIDDEIWGGIITLITVVVLVLGRFTLIQNFSTALVATFTLVTVINIVLLQSNPSWGFTLTDVMNGLSFRLPPDSGEGISIALMAFGIIGVGASELVMYPYWCQEKGYGRHVGPNDGSDEWVKRANGWMRVMRWDAWCSMFIYTFATVAFYLLGSSILWRSGLTPEGNDTIRYLAVMYEPVFGSTAQMIFLFGAIAVLYSTFFVANASHARTFSDALRVMGFAKKKNYRRLVVFFSGVFPVCCIGIYIFYPKPVQLVLISGLMQALMLPMLAGAGIFYRYCRVDKRIQPGAVWDGFLWISALGMLIAGGWLAWNTVADFF